MAVASLAAIVLFVGVMDENHSIRVNVAKRAQVDDVRIDPDHLPVALAQYPATVTGHTSGGQMVRCTIRSLHEEESPYCVILPSPAPIPQTQVRVGASVSSAPPTSTATQSMHGRNGARVTAKPPVAVPPVETTTQPVVVLPVETTPLPVAVPPVETTPPADDNQDRHHRQPADDNQVDDGHRALPGVIGSETSDGVNEVDTKGTVEQPQQAAPEAERRVD